MRYIIINIKIIYLLFFLISKTLANEVVPVDIIADEMQWNDNNKIAYAIGNAVATQGKKKISADKLIVHLDKGEDNNEIILIEAEGNVIFNNEKEVATGKIAKYNLHTEQISNYVAVIAKNKKIRQIVNQFQRKIIMSNNKLIRLSKSSIGDEEKNAVLKVLNKEYLGMGEEVKIFEEKLSPFQ